MRPLARTSQFGSILVKDDVILTLDPLRHRASIGATSVELPPLSFALLSELHAQPNTVVSIERLTEAAWGNVAVAPDTLKQRVFLLRKSLEDAGLNRVEIQSVRGQGYRLLVEDMETPGGFTGWRPIAMAVAALLAIGTFVFSNINTERFVPPANDRVVFWTEGGGPGTGITEWEQGLITRLSTDPALTYVVSERDPELTISEQSRSSRAAVVLLWTVVASGDRRLIRMQILEPKTAAALSTEIIDPENERRMIAGIDSQVAALSRLIRSGELPLLRDALVNTDHPAWESLRQLANPPN